MNNDFKVAMIGHPAAGKTVLVAGLYNTSGLQTTAFDDETKKIAERIQDQLRNKHQWPEGDAKGTREHLCFNLQTHKYKINLAIDNYAGEALYDPAFLANYVIGADGIIFLINVGILEDPKGSEKIKDYITKIKVLSESIKQTSKIMPPVALFVTASDRMNCPPLNSLENKEQLCTYRNEIMSCLKNNDFPCKSFDVSVTGNLKDQKSPIINPQNIDKGFGWLYKKREQITSWENFKSRVKRFFIVSFVLAMLIAIVVGAHYFYETSKIKAFVQEFSDIKNKVPKEKSDDFQKKEVDIKNFLEKYKKAFFLWPAHIREHETKMSEASKIREETVYKWLLTMAKETLEKSKTIDNEENSVKAFKNVIENQKHLVSLNKEHQTSLRKYYAEQLYPAFPAMFERLLDQKMKNFTTETESKENSINESGAEKIKKWWAEEIQEPIFKDKFFDKKRADWNKRINKRLLDVQWMAAQKIITKFSNKCDLDAENTAKVVKNWAQWSKNQNDLVFKFKDKPELQELEKKLLRMIAAEIKKQVDANNFGRLDLICKKIMEANIFCLNACKMFEFAKKYVSWGKNYKLQSLRVVFIIRHPVKGAETRILEEVLLVNGEKGMLNTSSKEWKKCPYKGELFAKLPNNGIVNVSFFLRVEEDDGGNDIGSSTFKYCPAAHGPKFSPPECIIIPKENVTVEVTFQSSSDFKVEENGTFKKYPTKLSTLFESVFGENCTSEKMISPIKK